MLCIPKLRIAILNEEIKIFRSRIESHGYLYNTIWTLERRVKELENQEKKLDKQEKGC
jgi:hypothetical protein|tara:strand:- start:743 stop:916 length:174 start_codon:yes stop_codon:yes gene_type:complete